MYTRSLFFNTVFSKSENLSTELNGDPTIYKKKLIHQFRKIKKIL